MAWDVEWVTTNKSFARTSNEKRVGFGIRGASFRAMSHIIRDKPGAKNWGFALLMQPARFAPGVPLVCFRYDGVRMLTMSIIADL
jgi:hypothetical protein